jgi:hypothetical protein
MNSSTRRQAWVVLALVAIDAFVKIAAFRWLPLDEPIRECFLCVALRVNVLNLGSAAQSLMASQGFHVFVTSAVFSGVLALALLIAGTKRPLNRTFDRPFSPRCIAFRCGVLRAVSIDWRCLYPGSRRGSTLRRG